MRIQYTLARSTGFPLPSLRAALALAALLLLTVSPPAAGENWQAWRGPRGDGTSKENDLPVTWNGKTGANIAWKISLPGTGHASPITWGDRIFTISTLEKSGERILLCLNKGDGSIRWQCKIFKAPLETIHRLNSRASSTPATDGKLVFSSFLKVDGRTVPAPNVGSPRPITPGTILVVAHDLDGKQKW